MQKIVVLIVISLLIPMAHLSAAQANSAQCLGNEDERGSYDCSGSGSISIPGMGGSGSDGPKGDSGGTGDPNVRRSSAKGSVDPKVLEARDLIDRGQKPTPEMLNAICTDRNIPLNETRNLCWVGTPLGGPDPIEGPTPEQLAQQVAYEYFHKIDLPKPNPQMSAKKGICGAIHSLDLGIDDEMVYSIQTPQGQLTMHVYGTVFVDWGDGRNNTYNSTGAPWPHSELTHYWEVSKFYDINTVVSWTADWSIGTIAKGTLGGAWTQGSINDWGVLEAQAVLVG